MSRWSRHGPRSLSNEVRCTHEQRPGVGPYCNQTCIMKEDQYTLDVAHSSSRTVNPRRVSKRIQVGTRLGHTPQIQERCQGRQRHVRQSPTYPKKRLARNVVSGRHHAREASERTCLQPRNTSCTTQTGADISNGHWMVPAAVAARISTIPTPSSKLQAFDTRMAIDHVRPPNVHHRARHATMLRRSLRAHIGRSLRTQASTLAPRTRRHSATRHLGVMR
jgi:hypothetical protein